MAFDLEEQEQLDELKAWWKRWGNLVGYGVIALLLGVAAFQYWKRYTANQAVEAASNYEAMQEAQQSGDKKTLRAAGAALLDKYPGSPYAARAAMLMAAVNIGDKDSKSAKAQLEWVVEHSKEAALKDAARLRLAGVLLDEKQYDAALKQLNAKHTDAFAPRFDDLKGDVYLAQGKRAEARAAYSAAFAALAETNPLRGVVEMKLDSLGGPAK